MNDSTPTTLHNMLEDYTEFLRLNTHLSPAHVHTRIATVRNLTQAHQDIPLDHVDFGQVQQMFDYWRTRPISQVSGRPYSVTTVQRQISELRRFLYWLEDFANTSWEIPRGFHRLNTRIPRLASDCKLRNAKRQCYSKDELALLYRHSHGLDRLMLLLGLNCGLMPAEMGRLTDKNVRYGKNSAQDTTVTLSIHGRQSSVYSEWPLWPETVTALEEIVRGHPPSLGVIFVSSTGRPLYNASVRNPSAGFANIWGRLTKRVQILQPDILRLPFGSVRATSASLIKELDVSNSVREAFLGQVVQSPSDRYYIRTHDEVFEAVWRLHEALSSLFASDPSEDV